MRPPAYFAGAAMSQDTARSKVCRQRQYFSLCPLAELGKLEELLGTEANLQVTEGFER